MRDPDFLRLKTEIESRRRMHGYYLIDLVSVSGLRREGLSEEEILDRVFRHFDDEDWPEDSPADPSWLDYRVERESARSHTETALVGGRDVGHVRDTIRPHRAQEFFDRFEALFGPLRDYFIGMGLGNSDYVFQRGVAISDGERVGILWVVEND